MKLTICYFKGLNSLSAHGINCGILLTSTQVIHVYFLTSSSFLLKEPFAKFEGCGFGQADVSASHEKLTRFLTLWDKPHLHYLLRFFKSTSHPQQHSSFTSHISWLRNLQGGKCKNKAKWQRLLEREIFFKPERLCIFCSYQNSVPYKLLIWYSLLHFINENLMKH